MINPTRLKKKFSNKSTVTLLLFSERIGYLLMEFAAFSSGDHLETLHFFALELAFVYECIIRRSLIFVEDNGLGAYIER